MVVAPSHLRIDRAALQHNIATLGKIFEPAEMAFVVKGNAYGHGIPTVVPAAIHAGQNLFCTFSAAEAEKVRRLAPQARIIIMGHIDSNDVAWAARTGLEIYVSRPGTWSAVQDVLAQGLPVKIHIDLETGMHRTGLSEDLAFEVAQWAVQEEHLHHIGTCTHLAGAESKANWPRIEKQMERYNAFLARLEKHGMTPGQRHVASSSAALLRPDLRLDLVRVGIAMYGSWPTKEVQSICTEEWEPKPVLSWRSRVWSVQTVPAGSFIGYGKNTQATADMRLAIVPVGYGDGFARGLSIGGRVLIGGKHCPIVGLVNMNMIQVDVTGVHVQEGDEVVLIGRQLDSVIGVQSFAEDQDMVNYELMTRLGQHLPRRGA